MKISTDASIFEIEPIDVIYPNNREDLIKHVNKLIQSKQHFTLRAGGTSIGGQAIGDGVLIDVSKHLTKIIDFSEEQKRVKVEPGVIQEDLNDFLKPYGLKFAPDTSTSNRAMIGGMIGNNSCGAYSIYYGTTREHVESIEVILSDGSLAVFKELSEAELSEKLQLNTLEGDIYRFVVNTLDKNQSMILEAFPDKSLIRRNTGYAIDELIRKHQPFNADGNRFSLAPLICGSEGTLAIMVSATLKLVELPCYKSLLVAQFQSEMQSLKSVEGLMQLKPAAVEFIDKPTLEVSKNNIEQNANRSWIKGDPEAVLVIEFFADSEKFLESSVLKCQQFLSDNSAYDCSIIPQKEHYKVWGIRKAGLGLLMGNPGPRKALAIIEDAAIPLKYLYQYYIEVKEIISSYNANAVYYGHASVGLIHIRPELDLSIEQDRETMKAIASDVADLVKKYNGSLSGEHGDGRIRAPYLRRQLGDKVYQLLIDLKSTFDPEQLLNPNVIISDQPIDQHLRQVSPLEAGFKTGFDWSKDLSFFSAAEKCNGAGACRKSIGKGVMCPSYKATRDENLSTRGRANLLRKALAANNPKKALNSQELKQALALCLGCKACKTECPASVDMAKLKSEYLYQTQSHQDQLELWRIRNLGKILKSASKMPMLFNWAQNTSVVQSILKLKGDLPKVQKIPLSSWWSANQPSQDKHQATVWVLCDIFTEYYDTQTGKDLLNLLKKCKVNIRLVNLDVSIVALISKGLLDEAKYALRQYRGLLDKVSSDDFIVGIEPSETLVWRDDARFLIHNAPTVFLFEELVIELDRNKLMPLLKPLKESVKIHLHCHQKSLASRDITREALDLIPGLKYEILNTGCCGAAGDFAYKNKKLSKVVHKTFNDTLGSILKDAVFISSGFSCSHFMFVTYNRRPKSLAALYLLASNKG